MQNKALIRLFIVICPVLWLSNAGRQHNIMQQSCLQVSSVLTLFLSLSLYIYIYICELYVLRCVKPSVTPHLRNSLTLTYTHMNADMSADSSLSHTHPTHIYEVTFVCVMGLTLASGLPLWVLCGLSLCLSLPLSRSPSLCHFFLSFFLSFTFSLSVCLFWLLSRWYISCSWHGSCIAYG